MALIEHFPRYYKESEIAKELTYPIDLENLRLSVAVEQTKKEFVVDTAIETLPKFEEEFGLPINPTGVTLEERRSRIKAKMRTAGTTTKELVKTVVSSWAYGNVEVIEDSSNYSIKIEFVDEEAIPPNLQYIKQIISEIIPAHLGVEYIFKYNTVKVLRDTGWTVAELKSKNLTVEQVPITDLSTI